MIIVTIISCKPETQIHQNHKVKDSVNQTSRLPIEYPFGQNIATMKMDSLNEFGTGDCWGNIRSISNTENSIFIDTMNCGDYGFYLNFYLFKNGRFQIAQQIEADYLTLDEQQIVTQDIYDYRNKPFKHLQKIDTGDYSINNYSSDKIFSDIPMNDHQTIYEHIIMNIEDPWQMAMNY